MSEIGLNISKMMDLTSYKKSGAHFKQRKVSVNPSNLSAYVSSSSTQDLYFDCPSSRNSMINGAESYLSFNITCSANYTTNPNMSLCNGSGSSVIRSLETTAQNQQLEVINQYNVFAAVLEDLYASSYRATLGTFNGNSGVIKTGVVLNGATGLDGKVIRVSIPLYSGIAGQFQNQFMPAVDGLRLKFTLDSTENAIVFDTVTGVTNAVYKLSNISLKMVYLDASQDMMDMLYKEGAGVLKIHGTSISNFQTTLQASSVNSLLIPSRFSSLKSLINVFRLSSNLASPALFNSTGGRYQPKLSRVNYNINGSNVYPSDILVNTTTDATGQYYGGEVINELALLFSTIGSTTGFQAVFNQDEFMSTAGTGKTDAFILASNFEENSSSQGVVSGINTNSSNIYLNLTHVAPPVGAVCDSFALYDLIVNISQAGEITLAK